MITRIRRHLQALAQGAPHTADHAFSWTDIAAWQLRDPCPSTPVDPQSWRDLLAQDYLAQVSKGASIFGKQFLYRQLMHGSGGEASVFGGRVMQLAADPVPREQLTGQLGCLREAESEVAATLYGEHPQPSAWMRRLWMLPLVVPAALLGLMLSTWSLALVIAACVALMLVQVAYSWRVQEWRTVRESLQYLLLASSRLGDRDRADRLNRTLAEPAVERLPLVREYREWFMLSNVRHYVKTREIVDNNRAYLKACFERCAQAEAELALARHIAGGQAASRPAAASPSSWHIEGMVHPLVEGATPLDLRIDGKGIFLTGQNGVGKSTLLRAVGLNLLVARAFGICHARKAALPDLPVFASFQNEDSLASGESLYIAELRRARELLDAGAGIFLVDEVFLGTNQLESVYAAGAVVRQLAAQGTVLLSTHNAMLLRVLGDLLSPWCLKRHPQGLVLEAGVLVEPNGLALLGERGFSPAIQEQAIRIYRELNAA